MTDSVLIIDALSAGTGHRTSSRDSIGCGPRTIAGVFELHNFSCNISRIEEVLTKKGAARGFEHLAISAMSMDLPVVKQATKMWRRTRPKGKVLLGGPIAAAPRTILSEIRPDVLILGEGEATLEHLIKSDFFETSIDLSEIPGIAFTHHSDVIITPKRPTISEEHLSDYFQPSTIRIMDYPGYQASRVYVEVLRGCSNFQRTKIRLPDGRSCTDCGSCDSIDPSTRLDCPEDIPPGCGFCSVPTTWGAPRSRSEAAIVREIQSLLDLEVHRIVLEAPGFLDYQRGPYPLTTPCSPSANIEAVSSLLSKIKSLPQMQDGTAHLSIENIKACLFTESVAETFSRFLPGNTPNIGMESGSESHARAIGKCSSPQDVLKAVRIAKKHNLDPFVYLIYGLPGEDFLTIKKSIEMVEELTDIGVERIILYGFRPLPGSAFADFEPPLHDSPMITKLKKAVRTANRDRKFTYLGRVIKSIAAEPSKTHSGYTMFYPLQEGPLITAQGGYSAGTLVNIEITEVLSDGLVRGEVVK
ncbi:MAG: radical SAM protein [Candidatus Lokiarchaeota archaeon]|nr:radical SAM protein [Candidatus Lokiarchaeota archaeon]